MINYSEGTPSSEAYPSPASIEDFGKRLSGHVKDRERINPDRFVDDVSYLTKINLNPDSFKKIYGILTDIGKQRKSVLAEPIAQRLKSHIREEDPVAIAKVIAVVRLLGYDYDPKMVKVIGALSKKYNLASILPPHPRDVINKKGGDNGFSRSRRKFVAGGLAAGLTLLGAGVEGNSLLTGARAASTVKFDSDKLFPTEVPIDPTKVDPTKTNTAVPLQSAATSTHEPDQLSSLQQADATRTPTSVPKKTATPFSTETPPPSATSTEVPTVVPTEAPKPKEIVGDKNLAEYFLGDLLNKLIQRRKERVSKDPASAERINKEFLGMGTLNFLYLGIDQTRERSNEFHDDFLGRADSIMLISFNPHTFETTVVSFPRDTFAPELVSIPKLNNRINAVTMAPFFDPKIDSLVLGRRIIESATGIPVDGVIKTNIDFMQGFDNHPGIFDKLFPDGLKINVTEHIVDDAYPGSGYGYIKVEFKPGVQVMHGRDLVHYGRSRHADSDFGRSERQRQILFSAMQTMFPKVIAEFVQGNTDTLDLMANILEDEGTQIDSASDINIVEILKTMKQGLIDLRNPQGLATLALLGANSAGLVKDMSKKQTMYGLTRENLIANVDRDDKFLDGSILRVVGQKGGHQYLGAFRPDRYGTFTSYWEPIRNRLTVGDPKRGIKPIFNK